LRRDISNPEEISEYIEDISQFLKRNVENKNISIPDYIEAFVYYKIKHL